MVANALARANRNEIQPQGRSFKYAGANLATWLRIVVGTEVVIRGSNSGVHPAEGMVLTTTGGETPQ